MGHERPAAHNGPYEFLCILIALAHLFGWPKHVSFSKASIISILFSFVPYHHGRRVVTHRR
jgi:hypothetical protein